MSAGLLLAAKLLDYFTEPELLAPLLPLVPEPEEPVPLDVPVPLLFAEPLDVPDELELLPAPTLEPEPVLGEFVSALLVLLRSG